MPVPERVPLRILLAEDNAVNQKVALGILSSLGYHAAVAANGIEVLQSLELADYDVILMDVQMPEMDGLEATRHIRQRMPREKRPRIVAMTANAMQGDKERCLEAGMDDYLPKPVRHEDLSAVLDRCVQIALNRRPQPEPAPKPAPVVQPSERTARSLDLNTLIGPKGPAKPKAPEQPSAMPSAPAASSRSQQAPQAAPSPSLAEPTSTPQFRAPDGVPPRSPIITPAIDVPPPFDVPALEEKPEPHAEPAAAPTLPAMHPAELDKAALAIHDHLRILTGVDDLGFVEEVLTSYLRADNLLTDQILSAHAQGDALTVSKAVHKLKSSSGILGAEELAAQCAELERHARGGQLDATAPLVTEIVRHVQRMHRIAERSLVLVHEQRTDGAAAPEEAAA